MTRMQTGVSLVALASALACGGLQDMISLQQGMAREFGIPLINVNLNNSVNLRVTFPNSAIADLPDTVQIRFARRVAEYVRDHFVRYDRLETIDVEFAPVRGSGAVRFTTSGPYRFTPRELGPPGQRQARHPVGAAT